MQYNRYYVMLLVLLFSGHAASSEKRLSFLIPFKDFSKGLKEEGLNLTTLYSPVFAGGVYGLGRGIYTRTLTGSHVSSLHHIGRTTFKGAAAGIGLLAWTITYNHLMPRRSAIFLSQHESIIRDSWLNILTCGTGGLVVGHIKNAGRFLKSAVDYKGSYGARGMMFGVVATAVLTAAELQEKNKE